ncbi:MAG: T9SS type A sorting domain-containing protein [Bacteroidales bacterium]|nr:T9SS type A sorting domain-containing protein [Bacteroidales bacterium]
MKIKNIIAIFWFMILLINQAYPQIITVKQDGTGDFTAIQQAIIASQDGDTVLAWPGIYYENLDFNGKSLTLASLNLTTGDPTYIHTTVIDGNQQGRCVTMNSNEQLAAIYGFTMRNGWERFGPHAISDNSGGGILAYEIGELKVTNCIIKDNQVNGGGGGIYCKDLTLYLSGVFIFNNYAVSGGGGICLVVDGNIIFDSINRCNIYLNYSARGNDFAHNVSHPIEVIVDTFTVMNPDIYYLSSTDMYGFQNGLITYDILHHKIEPVNGDLFVSPVGSDSNSGTSPDDPLRSVSFALTKIVSDSLHPNTIHLANGVYSLSFTDEKYPLNIRSHITIEGEHQDSVFLDGDSIIYILKGNNEVSDFVFRNLTICNGNGIINTSIGVGLMRLYVNYNALFENVSLTGGVGDLRSTFTLIGDNTTFKNVRIFENYGGFPHCAIHPLAFLPGVIVHDTVEFINVKYFYNQPSPNPLYGLGDGISVGGTLEWDNSMTVNFIGCEFTDNVENFTGWNATTCLIINENAKANLVNCTLGNNLCQVSPEGYAINIYNKGKVDIYNSILYGNVHHQASLSGDLDKPAMLNIYSSLVEGGQEDIYISDPVHTLWYDPSNIDTDPMWDTASMYPYSLSFGSPCIDAGTLDLPPGLELPEYDIAGNPRVYGESVDMGAYEYGPWVNVPSAPGSRFQVPGSKLLNVNPNPFTFGTYISYELKSAGRLNISIFNSSGMLVKTLVNFKGGTEETGEIYWDGAGPGGTALPAGIYFVRLTIDGKETETVKVVKVENSH